MITLLSFCAFCMFLNLEPKEHPMQHLQESVLEEINQTKDKINVDNNEELLFAFHAPDPSVSFHKNLYMMRVSYSSRSPLLLLKPPQFS